MEKELLHILSERTGCLYLSDLRYLANPDIIKAALKNIAPHDFSLSQWNGAVTYLTGVTGRFISAAEAKEYLLKAKIITKAACIR